jgi:hypothetical protein
MQIHIRGEQNYILLMSITKLFIAIMIAYLVFKGKLSYTDKVTKFFPKYKYDDITIKDILQHTTGLYSDWSNSFKYQVDSKHRDYSMLLTRVSDSKLFEYNIYDILCDIIEKISGSRVDKFIGTIFFNKYNIKYFWYSKGKPFGGFGLGIPLSEVYKLPCLMTLLKSIKYQHMLDYDNIGEYIGHSGSGGQFMYFTKEFDKFIFLANTGGEPFNEEFTPDDVIK